MHDLWRKDVDTSLRVDLKAMLYGGLICLALAVLAASLAQAQSGYDPTAQNPARLYDEAQAVYVGNLARRDNGVPPLRWNRQLT